MRLTNERNANSGPVVAAFRLLRIFSLMQSKNSLIAAHHMII